MIGIYGANGFIGRHLLSRLAARHLPIRAVSKHFEADFVDTIGPEVNFVEADFKESLSVAASLRKVDIVVQLISTSGPGLTNDQALTDIHDDVIPHIEFLQACIRSGVRRYIFLSSGGTVYGPGVPVPTPETAPTTPINSYGLTKLIVEKYIQMHGHIDGLEYVILRVANPFGPGQIFRNGQGLIPSILDRWQNGLPVKVFGNGSALRDYIYVDDVIDAIEAAAMLNRATSLVLNVGSGETRSVIDVIEAIEAITGSTLQREFVPSRNTDVKIANLDISLARQELGWAPKTPFLKGIERTIRSAYAPGHHSARNSLS